jgi:hypothetical protein
VWRSRAPGSRRRCCSTKVPELGVRTDFYWEEFRTVGEFDGKAKYGRDLRPGQDPGEAVYREKRREDALRDLGLQVVRWTWDELSRSALRRSVSGGPLHARDAANVHAGALSHKPHRACRRVTRPA